MLRCAACEIEMKAPEATGFQNQAVEGVTVSLKPKAKDALEVHVCRVCAKALKTVDKIMYVATARGKAPMVSIR